MKQRLRSSQSSNSNPQPLQQPLERSHYESPQKRREEEGQGLNEEAQYKLEKVFEEAGNREERYINLIREQEQRMNKQAERYLQSLKEMKKEFLQFMSKAKGERQVWRPLQALEHHTNKAPLRLNSLQFTAKTLLQYQQQEDKVEPQLKCKIHCYYYTPFAQDCLRYQLPQRLTIRIRGLQGGAVVERAARVIGQEDPADNLNCLLNRVPFQLAAEDDQAVVFQFIIPCTAQAIAHYRRKQAQIELLDERGIFLTAYGKINLTSLLHYEERPMEWQLKPLSLYSPIDGSKVAEISVKLGNTLQVRQKQEHYKVQSSTPMEVAALKARVDYNDDESRMIQRISKFKTATHSLLLGIGDTRQARAEKIFQSQGDRTILMHRQKKELQSILEYKNSHKSELMQKLFNEAIDRYFLHQCIVSTPNYVTYNYRSQERSHRKLLVKVELSGKAQEGQGESPAIMGVLQQMEARVMSPRQMALLIREEVVEVEQTQTDYEFDQEEQSMWAISGQPHAITVRILCLPLKQTLLAGLSAHYELKVSLLDEYGQVVESFHSKLKLRLPAPEHSLHLHGYCQAQSQMEIPFDEQSGLKKTVLSNANGVQLQWSASFNRLSLRVPHQYPGERTYYLTVNDSQNLYTISTYELVLTSYPKSAKHLSLRLGEVSKLVLDFAFNEEQMTKVTKEAQGKGKKGMGSLRVGIFSSKPQHCNVNIEGEEQMVCQLNKSYQIQAKVQTFDPVPNPEKILMHAVDLDRKTVLKRWLLSVQKEQTENFKQVLRLSCEHGKPLRYKFQLMNEDINQRTFRFYSSNLALLAAPQSLTLISNQRVTVQLLFHVRVAMSPEQALQPLRVILTVTDGTTFNNYLFELNVRLK